MSYQQDVPGYRPVDPSSDAYWYPPGNRVPDTQLPGMQGIAGSEQYYRSLLQSQQTADARYMQPTQPGFAPWQPPLDAALSSQASEPAGSSGKTERGC